MFLSTSLPCCLPLAVDIAGPPWPLPSVPDVSAHRLGHPECSTLGCSRTSHWQQLRTPECLTFGRSTTCWPSSLSRISSVDLYSFWRRLPASSFGTRSDTLGRARFPERFTLGGLPLHWWPFRLPRLRFHFRLYPVSVSEPPGVGSFVVLHLFSSVRTPRPLFSLPYILCLPVRTSELYTLGRLTLRMSCTSRSDFRDSCA